MRSSVAKRAMDVLGASAALVLLSPVMILTAVVVRFNLGSPVLFRQTRPGLYGKPFDLYKFRTMRDAFDGDGNALPDEQRMTPVGRFLRSSSVDELPELWNVLRGDMSLVGPRPLLMRYLDRYTPRQMRRHEVRPGLTGWAQINGRNALTWEQKFEADLWYVDNQSIWLDLKIIVRTVVKVLQREGIHQADHVTVEEFRGTQV